MTIHGKSTAAAPFDTLIKWMYRDDNLKALRHWPDVFVRPGGGEFGISSDTNPPITPDDAAIALPDLKLQVEPLPGEVSLGAPVRVEIKLTNTSQEPISVPSDISLKSNYLSGSAVSDSGESHGFNPFICYERDEQLTVLEHGQSAASSLTLLRGGQSAPFPTSGVFDINAKLSWGIYGEDGTVECYVSAKTTIMVTPPVEKSHSAAAHKMLTTPDSLLVMVMGVDHITDGIEVIQKALGDKTLRPHFACIEARRLATLRTANIEGAKSIVSGGEDDASEAEKKKLKKLGIEI